MSGLGVCSESSPLLRVLLHAPGPEVERALPWAMRSPLAARGQLWSWIEIQAEYQQFREALERAVPAGGVLWLRDLLGEVFADDSRRLAVLADVLGDDASVERYVAALRRSGRSLGGLSGHEVAEHVIGGMPTSWNWLREGCAARPPLLPQRTLTWMRDAAVMLPDGAVVIGRSARPHRAIEPRILRALFTHHPSLAADIVLDFAAASPGRTMAPDDEPVFEGGDVLVASREVLVVGVGHATHRFSDRTRVEAVQRLATRLFSRPGAVDRIYAVRLPDLPGFIHLDTILTFYGPRAAVVMPYVFGEPEPWNDVASVFLEATADAADARDPEPVGPSAHPVGEVVLFERGGPAGRPLGESLLRCLREERLLDDDRIVWLGSGREDDDDPFDRFAHALWEQRQLGCNVLATAPFEVVAFRRAWRTAEALSDHVARAGGGRVVLLQGNELVKPGGGPHCLVLPLARGT